MNANELAERLEEKSDTFTGTMMQESATMLRQQQAEIEALKIECNRLYRIIELNGTLK